MFGFFRGKNVISIATRNFEDKTARSFHFKLKGKRFEGFVIRWGSDFFAYQNLCQHLPVTLDLRDNNFFNHDKTALQCHMHGALYEVTTGECTAGPCVGSHLKSLPIEIEETRIVISLPEHAEV